MSKEKIALETEVRMIQQSVVPLVHLYLDEMNIKPGGSGVLINVKNKYFLLTAKHVVDFFIQRKAPIYTFRVGEGSSIYNLKENLPFKIEVINTHKSKHSDFAILEIEKLKSKGLVYKTSNSFLDLKKQPYKNKIK